MGGKHKDILAEVVSVLVGWCLGGQMVFEIYGAMVQWNKCLEIKRKFEN